MEGEFLEIEKGVLEGLALEARGERAAMTGAKCALDAAKDCAVRARRLRLSTRLAGGQRSFCNEASLQMRYRLHILTALGVGLTVLGGVAALREGTYVYFTSEEASRGAPLRSGPSRSESEHWRR